MKQDQEMPRKKVMGRTGDALAVLERAIADVGHWRWWAKTDNAFQIEFGWVMLFIPSEDASRPPSNTVALRFSHPRCIVALQRATEGSDLPDDWFAKLGRDEIEPLAVCDESFTLTNVDQLHSICRDANRRDFILGDAQDLDDIGKDRAFLAFGAGNGGLVVVGESMEVLSHRGRFEIQDIGAEHAEWWKYWREYWDRIDSDDPLPCLEPLGIGILRRAGLA